MGKRRGTIPTLDSLRARRDEILKIATAHGVRRVRVFGSVAVGYATEKSDIDLVVDMEDGLSWLDLGNIEEELEALLGHKVDIVETPRRRTRFARQVLREAVPL